MEYKHGLMVLNMKVNGYLDKLVEMENFIMLQVKYIMGVGYKIKLVVLDRMQLKMEVDMMDNGKIIYKMVMEWKHGLMIQYTRDNL